MAAPLPNNTSGWPALVTRLQIRRPRSRYLPRSPTKPTTAVPLPRLPATSRTFTIAFPMETVARTSAASTQAGPSTSASQPDRLPIPQSGDSIAVIQKKLTALADAVSRGQSIAVVTKYAASTVQEHDPVKLAVAEMSPQELDSWGLYAEGKYRLPKLDWNESRLSIPTSAKPLRTAHRRADEKYRPDQYGPDQYVKRNKTSEQSVICIKDKNASMITRDQKAQRDLTVEKWAVRSRLPCNCTPSTT